MNQENFNVGEKTGDGGKPFVWERVDDQPLDYSDPKLLYYPRDHALFEELRPYLLDPIEPTQDGMSGRIRIKSKDLETVMKILDRYPQKPALNAR